MNGNATASTAWDAVVVGAGPGGSATAYHLARAGRRVLLLDRHRFPRDKSCGDGITRVAMHLLDEMGVLDRLRAEGSPIGGVRVHMRGRGQRDFPYPIGQGGLVVPRMRLDAVLAERAVEAGAVFHQATEARRLRWRGGLVVGLWVLDALSGADRELHSSFVVAADGAASAIGRQAGLLTPASGWGSALRGYFEGIAGLGDRLEIFMPLTDASDAYVLPSYGWVFPLSPGWANIGVGLFEREAGENLRGLFERFVAWLAVNDSRFVGARLRGATRGAPLRFDFAPERCAAPGLLLVGDAAGLVSPFTGEGISYALESGRIAAQVIQRCLRATLPSRTEVHDYATLLGHRFAGYFETGRHAGQRYRLVWHVLDTTFRSERPLHRLCRQLVLVPEGTGNSVEETALTDVSPLLPVQGRRLRREMLAIGATLNAVVRQDWPFLAQFSGSSRDLQRVPFRPALLLLLCAEAGPVHGDVLRQVGAAVELGFLGFLAQGSVQEQAEERATAPDRTNWGNRLAILLGDFLLAKALELSSGAEIGITRRIVATLEEACLGRLAQVRQAYCQDMPPRARMADIDRTIGRLFELPCRLGAILGKARGLAPVLARYGRGLGVAYALAEDIKTIEDPSLASAIASDFDNGIYGVPVLLALRAPCAHGERLRSLLRRPGPDRAEAYKMVAATGVLADVRRLAMRHAETAQAALTALPSGPVRSGLHRLAAFAVTREVGARGDLDALLEELGHPEK
ncbi:geranylgeranyl reductase family protein [Inquilinus limosus]|uniref:geranylgeranyl reductase family protein n=1 Tax=Inquilinus limosus TaxID=171674 RepID=UPI003F5CD77B